MGFAVATHSGRIVLVFVEEGKPENQEKKLEARTRTNNKPNLTEMLCFLNIYVFSKCKNFKIINT